MEVIVIILSALVVTGLALWIHDRAVRRRKDAGELSTDVNDASTSDGDVCCGMHITCERDSLLAAVSDDIVYYDDEELDRYKGRTADSYTAAEADEFRDILLTLLPTDIAGWGRSIQLRGIELPTDVREELIMIVAEARSKADNH